MRTLNSLILDLNLFSFQKIKLLNTSSVHLYKTCRDGGVTQVVDYLHNKHKVLISNPNTTKNPVNRHSGYFAIKDHLPLENISHINLVETEVMSWSR
jgi:hypothetical protein